MKEVNTIKRKIKNMIKDGAKMSMIVAKDGKKNEVSVREIIKKPLRNGMTNTGISLKRVDITKHDD